ncbi:trigger factor [Lachnoclostridium sp. Marseille-P6806]|uniref:trigger factor n=1 Tax=Lachnoclostridium sp. Marseille-P6806 TaxID=2364793 RepID=UPI0010323094|nr:trigger factor [Lachnoclostridium sp. Marseille-P6806]
MKKRILTSALAAVTALSMAGCGSTDKSAYITGITASDYVEVADYASIPVEEAAPSVSDSYVEMYINYTLSGDASYEDVTDRDVVADGDTVNIDYVGKIDGEEFSGGSAQGYNLQIGSGSFIDGFEDGLIGEKTGSKPVLHLKFPDEYSNAEVAGKDVDFEVTINSIETLVTPELTDEWAAKQNIAGVSTAEDYRSYVRKELLAQAQSTYDTDVRNKIADYLEENSNFVQEPPAAMVDRYYASLTEYYTQYAAQYGMDLATFMQYVSPTASEEETDGTAEAASAADTEESAASGDGASSEAEEEETPAYEATLREQAARTAKQYIILGAIAEKENITIGKREYNAALDSAAAKGGYASVSEYKKNEDAYALYESLLTDKVMEFLVSHAVITEPASDSGIEESSADSTEDASAEDAGTGDAAASASDAGNAEENNAEAGAADAGASDADADGLGVEETEGAAQMGY